MNTPGIGRPAARIDTLAALLLLIVLTALTLLLVGATGGTYQAIRQSSTRLQQTRTGLYFVATRVRESDSDQVDVVTAPWGGNALVITESSASGRFEDWIYSYSGALREVLVPGGTPFLPAAGQVISEAGGISFARSGNLLEIRTSAGGQPALSLHLEN